MLCFVDWCYNVRSGTVTKHDASKWQQIYSRSGKTTFCDDVCRKQKYSQTRGIAFSIALNYTMELNGTTEPGGSLAPLFKIFIFL